DAVFVVAGAQFGGAQPKGAVAFVGVSGGNQRVDDLFHAPAGVQRAFQVVVVEFQAECLEIQILLAAQVGHGKDADVVQAVDVAGGGDRGAICAVHGSACLEIAGDVHDVVALVAVGREGFVIGADAAR